MDQKEARANLGLPDDMNDHNLIANTRLHAHLITELNLDPPPYGYKSPCCTYCCRMSHQAKYLYCPECELIWCSQECYEFHRSDQCHFVSRLGRRQLTLEERERYISTYSFALPPTPAAPAPAAAPDDYYYHQPHVRISPIYLPTIGWMHGEKLMVTLDYLFPSHLK